ncbi:MAG: cell wall hydrolase [Candidatus Magasanikbacteria bacterium]|nr:cell wall hydrolase [Candidatus Magasanikbacteria bacterium]
MFKKINTVYTYIFSVDSDGFYSVFISAICKKRNYLRAEIDTLALKGVLPKSKNEYFNVPPAWNGNELKGVSKTVVLIIKLSQGNHNLKFVPKGEAEMMLEPKITLLDKSGLVTLFKDVQSEEKDCQPWIVVALINLPLAIMDISVSCKKKFLDSDDVKLIIDSRIQKNSQAIWRGKNWFWRGWQLKGKIQTDRFYPNLPTGVHYVELWADRTPVLKNLDILIAKDASIKRIPTADDPEWTGDFFDDPEEIILARLIFGDARNQSQEAKEWVGWSVINRTKANSWWPDNIHGAILQAGQYDALKSTDSNFTKIINPLGFKNVNDLEKKSWFECCEIAKGILAGGAFNPTTATHFHSFIDKLDIERFEKNIVPKGKFLKKIGQLYFYWSPN